MSFNIVSLRPEYERLRAQTKAKKIFEQSNEVRSTFDSDPIALEDFLLKKFVLLRAPKGREEISISELIGTGEAHVANELKAISESLTRERTYLTTSNRTLSAVLVTIGAWLGETLSPEGRAQRLREIEIDMRRIDALAHQSAVIGLSDGASLQVVHESPLTFGPDGRFHLEELVGTPMDHCTRFLRHHPALVPAFSDKKRSPEKVLYRLVFKEVFPIGENKVPSILSSLFLRDVQDVRAALWQVQEGLDMRRKVLTSEMRKIALEKQKLEDTKRSGGLAGAAAATRLFLFEHFIRLSGGRTMENFDSDIKAIDVKHRQLVILASYAETFFTDPDPQGQLEARELLDSSNASDGHAPRSP